LKFAIYNDQQGNHRVQAVSVSQTSFANRVSICEAYRGKRNEELNQVAGITDGIFVHAAGFMGGAASLDSAFNII